MLLMTLAIDIIDGHGLIICEYLPMQPLIS